jgi:hypothetical protein
MLVWHSGVDIECCQTDHLHGPDHAVEPVTPTGTSRGEPIRIDHKAPAVVVRQCKKLRIGTAFSKQVLVQIGAVREEMPVPHLGSEQIGSDL